MTILDCTVGYGGHAELLLESCFPGTTVIGLDRDSKAIDFCRQRLIRFRERVVLLRGNHRDLKRHLAEAGVSEVDGVLFDFGVSSPQLDDPARGFSFQAEGPLDMRMDPHSERTAEQVVNRMGESDLADVIYEFGDERRSRRIARAIVRARPIRSTAHLAQVISAAARPMKSGRLHPATRTFQAIRIFVNHELEDLEALLEAAPRVLNRGGRLVILSFHSLEDRRVKDALRAGAKEGLYRVLTRKPVTAGAEEVERNPRARSVKLRAAERL